jgi:ankyrin repeat protein
LAVEKGYADIVRVLLQYGADVNAIAEDDGYTALHLAVYYGHLEVVITLLQKGADINIKDINGKTVLDIAYENGHTDIAHFLKKHLVVANKPQAIINKYKFHSEKAKKDIVDNNRRRPNADAKK